MQFPKYQEIIKLLKEAIGSGEASKALSEKYIVVVRAIYPPNPNTVSGLFPAELMFASKITSSVFNKLLSN